MADKTRVFVVTPGFAGTAMLNVGYWWCDGWEVTE